MSFFAKILYKRAERKSARVSKSTEVNFVDYTLAKKILILLEIKSDWHVLFINKLFTLLSNEGKDVSVLVYVSKKASFSHVLPQNTYLIREDELNWKKEIPSSLMENLNNKEYDLLIDLTFDKIIPISYFLMSSTAKFKIGRYIEKNLYYNFMIDLRGQRFSQIDPLKEGENEEDVTFHPLHPEEYLFKYVLHYLKIINFK